MHKDNSIVYVGGDDKKDPFRLNMLPYTSSGRGMLHFNTKTKTRKHDKISCNDVDCINSDTNGIDNKRNIHTRNVDGSIKNHENNKIIGLTTAL